MESDFRENTHDLENKQKNLLNNMRVKHKSLIKDKEAELSET